MAITTSRGYPGLVTATDWAILSRHQGQSYAVLGHDHLVASKGTGDRGISISNGTAVGHGVMDTNVGAVNLNAAAMGAAGSRWDTIALERDWATETSQLVILQGSSAKTISSLRQRNVGTGKDHQPLWLARVDNGKTDIMEFVDVRVWQQDGGLLAGDPIARDYMDALGTDMLCKNGIRYIRVTDPTSGFPVWSEHRKTVFGPRPTIFASRRHDDYRPGPVNERLGAATGVNFSDAAAYDTFTWVAGDYGAVGAQFITKKAGMYSLWANLYIAHFQDMNAEFYWGSTDHQPIGGLPGSYGWADAGVVGGSMADVPNRNAYRKFDLQALRYLEAGAVISISYSTDRAANVMGWNMWAQRISD